MIMSASFSGRRSAMSTCVLSHRSRIERSTSSLKLPGGADDDNEPLTINTDRARKHVVPNNIKLLMLSGWLLFRIWFHCFSVVFEAHESEFIRGFHVPADWGAGTMIKRRGIPIGNERMENCLRWIINWTSRKFSLVDAFLGEKGENRFSQRRRRRPPFANVFLSSWKSLPEISDRRHTSAVDYSLAFQFWRCRCPTYWCRSASHPKWPHAASPRRTPASGRSWTNSCASAAAWSPISATLCVVSAFAGGWTTSMVHPTADCRMSAHRLLAVCLDWWRQRRR